MTGPRGADFPFDPCWWMEFAACKGKDPDIFFPTRGDACGPAKAICADCPVKHDCLHHALVVPERTGVWGGTSERERRKMRKRLRREFQLPRGSSLREVI